MMQQTRPTCAECKHSRSLHDDEPPYGCLVCECVSFTYWSEDD